MEKVISQIKEFAKQKGLDVGFCTVDDSPCSNLNTAISFVKKLSDAVVEEISDTPTHTYFHHYKTVNNFLDISVLEAGNILEQNGFRYYPVAASQSINLNGISYSGKYSHKKAAYLSGLGYIGKNALFLHKEYGPRVRLATLFCDVPLNEKNKPLENTFCDTCNLCIKACPAMALSGLPVKNVFENKLVDPAACSKYMKDKFQHIGRGVVCGICIKVCPYGN